MCQRMTSCLPLPRVTKAFPCSPRAGGSRSSTVLRLHRSPGALAAQWVSCGPPGLWVGSMGHWAEKGMTREHTPAWQSAYADAVAMGFYQASPSLVVIREAPTPPTSFTCDSALGCHLLAPSPLLPSQLCQGEMET